MLAFNRRRGYVAGLASTLQLAMAAALGPPCCSLLFADSFHHDRLCQHVDEVHSISLSLSFPIKKNLPHSTTSLRAIAN